jgi:hypothetical protein
MTIQFDNSCYKIQKIINVNIKPATKSHEVVGNTHTLYFGGSGSNLSPETSFIN